MSVLVRIPTPLRRYTGGKAEVEAEGRTVREVFEDIERTHGGISEKIFDATGEVRRFVNLFVNGEDLRGRANGSIADAQLETGDELSVVPAIAGGAA